MHTPRIALLLMTYNGMAYLDELLRSLYAQTYTHWTLYIQDDFSTDGTYDYLRTLPAKDSRICVMDRTEKMGPMKGFLTLLRTVKADYYMFCDQDDVWMPEKIEVTLGCMRRAEETYGPTCPVAVHTDLTVTDSHLRVTAPSFWHISRIEPELLRTFNEQAGHNLCTGCTMMLNGAAREVSADYTDRVLMHDAWVTLRVLHAGGHIAEVRRPTILYRQHGSNSVGARDVSRHYVTSRLARLGAVWRENRARYAMFRDAGYGSVVLYLYHKWRYFLRYKHTLKTNPQHAQR